MGDLGNIGGSPGSRAQLLAVAGVALGLWFAALVWAFWALRETPPEGVSRVFIRLDPNTASAQELEALPYVGRTLAERIAKDRELRGPFRSPEDLLRVKGMTQELLGRIAPFIEIRTTGEGLGRENP